MKPSRRLRLELQMFIQTQEEQTGAAQSTPSSLIFVTRTALSKPPLRQLPFMQLIGGLVERGSLVPHLGSSLRNRPYSRKHFATIQVAADCLQLRIARDFCDQLPADIGISKLAQSHHRCWTQGAGSKAQDASTSV